MDENSVGFFPDKAKVG